TGQPPRRVRGGRHRRHGGGRVAASDRLVAGVGFARAREPLRRPERGRLRRLARRGDDAAHRVPAGVRRDGPRDHDGAVPLRHPPRPLAMLRPLSLSFERSLAARSPENALTEVRRTFAGLQEQMATGRRVNRPSDDPTAFEQARTWEAHAERLDGHLRAVSAARLWTSHTAEALDGLVELTMTAHEHGVRGRNDSLSDADREALALRIDSLLEEAVDRLNGQVEGEYLFAGNQTGTEPFAADGTPNAGDFSGLRVRRIGPGVDLAVNVPGDRV